jgi:hypothetical protein
MIDKGFLVQLTNHLYRLTLLFPKKEPLRYKMRELADEILADYLRVIKRKNSLQSIDLEAERLLENLDILDSFFSIAKEQNWVSLSQIFIIQKEYTKIVDYLSSIISWRNISSEDLNLEKGNRNSEKEKEIIVNKKKEEEEKLEEEKKEEEFFERFPREKVIALSASLESLQGEEALFKNTFLQQASFQQETRNKLNLRQQKILELLRKKDKLQVWEVKRIFPEITKRTLRRDFKNLLNQGLIQRIGEKNNTFYCLNVNKIGQTILV